MRDAGYPSSEPIKLVCFFCPYEAKDLGDYDDHIKIHDKWLREQVKPIKLTLEEESCQTESAQSRY